MLNLSEPIECARLLASSEKVSSKWLQVIPSSQLGLLMDDNTARIAVALRLGSQICEEHICQCGSLVDRKGRHGLSCKFSSGRFSRHCAINKIISNALSSAGFPNIIEPPGINREDGKRPNGMTLIPWFRGKALLWDVTVGDTVAQSYLSSSAHNPGTVAENAERRKHNHYSSLKSNYHFTPISFETFGCMGSDTKEFLTNLGRCLKRSTGESRTLNFILQKISIEIQRGNAASVLGTMPQDKENIFSIFNDYE